MWFSRKVRVECADASGRVFAKSDMPPEQLPESFLLDTTMHLGDRNFQVLAAEPPLREQFAKTKKLRLTLRPVAEMTSVDPKDILFSLPTINDALPADGGAADGSEVVLAEDDWRQLELIEASQSAAIEAELAAIRTVRAEHRRGIGFTSVHVRKAIVAPLSIPLSALAFAGAMLPLRFRGHGERVAGGFAANLEGWLLYGVAHDGIVRTLGLQPSEGELPSAVTALAAAWRLVLVDWVRAPSL